MRLMRDSETTSMLTALPSQPSTPLNDRVAPPPPNRRLWSSPTISDYFSGDDSSSFTFSPDSAGLRSSSTWDSVPGDRKPRSTGLEDSYTGRGLNGILSDLHLSRSTQIQRQLLDRLNAIGRAILEADLTEDHCDRLSLDIEKLEQTLAAPDSQSREPAEIAEQGLFVDDDATETEVESTIVSEVPVAKNREAAEMIARVTEAAGALKERLIELKHINDITTTRLEAAAQEIAHLRDENDVLRNEDQDSELLYLKLRLNSLEERAKAHLDRKGQEELLEDIERLSIATSPTREESVVERTTETMDASTSNISTDVDEKPTHPMNGSLSYSNGSLYSQTLAPTSEHSESEEEELTKEIEDEKDEPLPSPTAKKDERSPWQRLWDELADFAGIHDEYGDQSDHD